MSHQEKEKRTAIVTGAYGAIGSAIAAGIASAGYHVTLVGRDPGKLENICNSLIMQTSNPGIRCKVVDLGSQAEILELSRNWRGPLHLLVNNAATAPRTRTETGQGLEVQWAVNVMGYFWMMHYFHPFMYRQTGARIVNVASYWAGGLDPADPQFVSRPYDNDVAYRQAKQANRMLSHAFAMQLKPAGIAVNSCHPGDVNSKLSNAFGFRGSESPRQGAATPLYLALSEEPGEITGKYFEHMKQVSCPFVKERMAVENLYDYCRKLSNL